MKTHDWKLKAVVDSEGNNETFWECSGCGVDGGLDSDPSLVGFITKQGYMPGAEDCDSSLLLSTLYKVVEEQGELVLKYRMKIMRQRMELKRLNRTVKGIRDVMVMCNTLAAERNRMEKK